MKRKIKFRAWATLNKKGSFIKFDIDNPNPFDWTVCDFTPIFQEFTGLKDVKGKEIYEGDIIKYVLPWGNNDLTLTRIVKYNESFLSFMLYCPTQKKFGIFLHEVQEVKDLKVIGNIFENPELLK